MKYVVLAARILLGSVFNYGCAGPGGGNLLGAA